MKLTKRAPLVHKAAHASLALLLIFSTTLAVKPVSLLAETNFSPTIPDCQGLTIAGTAMVSRRGCTITLQHNASDRRVLIRVDDCRKTGNASMQLFSPPRTFTITDRNTANNTCSCPAN